VGVIGSGAFRETKKVTAHPEAFTGLGPKDGRHSRDMLQIGSLPRGFVGRRATYGVGIRGGGRRERLFPILVTLFSDIWGRPCVGLVFLVHFAGV
jgi:hypothetical protein